MWASRRSCARRRSPWIARPSAGRPPIATVRGPGRPSERGVGLLDRGAVGKRSRSVGPSTSSRAASARRNEAWPQTKKGSGQLIPYRLEGTEAPHPVRRRRDGRPSQTYGPDHRRLRSGWTRRRSSPCCCRTRGQIGSLNAAGTPRCSSSPAASSTLDLATPPAPHAALGTLAPPRGTGAGADRTSIMPGGGNSPTGQCAAGAGRAQRCHPLAQGRIAGAAQGARVDELTSRLRAARRTAGARPAHAPQLRWAWNRHVSPSTARAATQWSGSALPPGRGAVESAIRRVELRIKGASMRIGFGVAERRPRFFSCGLSISPADGTGSVCRDGRP